MKDINLKALAVIRGFCIGFLLVCFLITDTNLERMSLMLLTIIVFTTIKRKWLNTQIIYMLLISFIIGCLSGNLIFYYFINNFESYYRPNYYFQNSYKDKSDKPAVILIADGETPTYNFTTILSNIYSKKSLAKKVAAPIEAYKYKRSYEKMGQSQYLDLCKHITNTLQTYLGYDYDVYNGYLKVKPYYTQQLYDLSKKYKKIILVPLFLSESDDYKKFISNAEAILSSLQINYKVTPLLWQSEKLSRQLTFSALKLVKNDDRNLSGIILLKSNKNVNRVQERTFINKIISNMDKYGFDMEKIVCLSLNNDIKSIYEAVEKFRQKGVSRIIIVSVSDLIDNLKRQSKIDSFIKKIARDEKIKIYYINGWNVGENLIYELEYKIRLANLKD